jgi:hypothetical protein
VEQREEADRLTRAPTKSPAKIPLGFASSCGTLFHTRKDAVMKEADLVAIEPSLSVPRPPASLWILLASTVLACVATAVIFVLLIGKEHRNRPSRPAVKSVGKIMGKILSGSDFSVQNQSLASRFR